MSKKKNKKKIFVLSFIIGLLLFIGSIGFVGAIIYSDILPFKYLIILILFVLVINVLFIRILIKKKFKAWIKILIMTISSIFILIYGIGLFYINRTYDFMDKIMSRNMVTETYYIVVNKNSAYKKIKDIKSQDVGTYDEKIELYDKAINEFNKLVSSNLINYDAVDQMARDLMNNELSAIIISAAHKETIDSDLNGFRDNTKILEEINIQVKQKNVVNHASVDVTEEVFTIFLSGMDAYGNVSARGRSDVNMLITLNPNTYEVLLTSIPRDYYVQLHGTAGYKDKLTHAGFYGVDMSINTIEEFMGIDIDCYIKVNFSTLVEIVDTIGGVDVYSDASFVPWTNPALYIKEGNIHMDGKTALAFARERHAYLEGDRHRIQNQQDVISAIINKLTSSTELLTKYTNLLDSISNYLDTNLSTDNITSLIKLQLDKMPSWNIKKYSVNGTDDSNFTYTFGTQQLYVMQPTVETITMGAEYINGMKKGKTFSQLGI